jgi:uncharacterized delta-60 repeat protein
VRFTTGGALDSSFGTGGAVDLPDTVTARALALDGNGGVLIGGEGGFTVSRYGPDGSLDTGFGSNGQAPDPTAGRGQVNAIAVQADGGVVAGGLYSDFGFTLARWSAGGSLDTGFGQQGLVRTSFNDIGQSSNGYDARLTRLVVLGDGSLLAGGADAADSGFARYHADGSLDASFGRGGRFDVLADTYSNGVEGLAVQPDGGIVALGRAYGIARHLTLVRVSTGPIGSRNPPTSTTATTTGPNPLPSSSSSTTTTAGPAPTGPTPPGSGPTPTTDPAGTDGGQKASAPSGRSGYWMVSADGTVYAFGDAVNAGDPHGALGGARVVHLEPTPGGNGYWVLDDRGRVRPYGDANAFGDVDPSALAKGEVPTTMAATPTGRGYWIFTNRGRALTFGDATFFGDMAKTPLNGPVLGSVATPSGRGYYMVASDGGIFTFGDATFHGSTGNIHLNQPVMGMAPAPGGYWLVASDGGIFAFDAPFHGSMGSVHLNRPISGLVPARDGYLMVAQDGGIFSFGSVAFHGSLGANPPASPIVSVALLG